MVHLVVGSGCSHSDERRLVPWVVNLLFRVSGRSGVAGQVDDWTRDGLRVACVSLRALADHTGFAGVVALPVVRSISSAPEWPAVGCGVASILVSDTSQYTDRESSGAGVGGAPGSGHVIFVRLVDRSTRCVAAPMGSDIIPSVSVCVWGCVGGVSII